MNEEVKKRILERVKAWLDKIPTEGPITLDDGTSFSRLELEAFYSGYDQRRGFAPEPGPIFVVQVEETLPTEQF